MPSTTQILTAEELWNMPDNGGRNELVRGEIHERMPHTFRHGVLISELGCRLDEYVEGNRLGSVAIGGAGFILQRSPDFVLSPDIAFVSTDRLPSPQPEKWWEMAPDFAIEISSESDAVYPIERKIDDWIRFGCSMVVNVSDRHRTVTIYRPGQSPQILSGNDILDGGVVAPGFRLPLPEIFG